MGDQRSSPIPPGVAAELARQADEDLCVRLAPGVAYYPAFLSIVWATTDYPTLHPAYFQAAVGVVGVSVAVRALVTWRRRQLLARGSGWLLGLQALSVTGFGLTCGLMLAHSIWAYGYSHATYASVLLWTTGLGAGAPVSFMPRFPLLILHVFCLLTPPLVTALVKGESSSWAYAVANVLFAAFILGNGRRMHDDYHERAFDLYREAERRREVEAAHAAASEANRAKSAFLANTSHEIRTPLHGILGMAELALAGELPEREREQIETLHGSANQLLQILNDILDLSKVEAGRMELAPEPFSPLTLVRECCQTFAARAALKGIALGHEATGAVDVTLVGDGGRLRQVLLNLLGNAVKFTNAGSVRLEMRVEEAAEGAAGEPACRVHFAVCDTGEGIPPEKHAAIFEAFGQVSDPARRNEGGTGLGLTISNRLVGLMGSSIAIESEPGRGSCFSFTVTLPVAARPLGTEPAAAVGGSRRRELRVLLVEDHPVNQKVASGVLRQLGHSVEVAGNGQEAVKAFAAGEFDVVLMDSQLPDMDGLTATAELRALEAALARPHTPVVAATADAMVGARERYLAGGMDDYIAKPFRPAELAAVLDRQIVR